MIGRISIHASQVIAQITTDSPNIDFETLRNLNEGDIRHFVDCCGFMHGLRFDVDIISSDTGGWRVCGIEIPVLKQHLEGKTNDLLRKYLYLSLSNSVCAIVMAEFREAMRSPQETGFHCY